MPSPTRFGAVRCGARYFRDGKAELVLAVPLDTLGLGDDWADPSGARMPPEGHASGVIVDATGITEYVPSFEPRLVSGEGDTVYGPWHVSRSYGRIQGGAAYHVSLEAARQDPRIGDTPIVVKAVGIGNDPRDLVLAPEGRATWMSEVRGTALPVRAAVAVVVEESKIRQ